jgi:hypothetical protein
MCVPACERLDELDDIITTGWLPLYCCMIIPEWHAIIYSYVICTLQLTAHGLSLMLEHYATAAKEEMRYFEDAKIPGIRAHK